MWYSYLKAAIRGIRKNPQYALLNIFGLAIGMSIASLLLLYLHSEWSFNKYHQNFESIHRVIVNADLGETQQKWANAPNAVGPTAVKDVPGVTNQVRMLKHNFGDAAFIQVDDRKYVEQNLYWIDSTLLEIFDFEILLGDSRTPLHAPNQVMLSESSSRRMFGASNPIGQVINVDHRHDLEVTAVYRDLPDNSSLDATIIGSFSTSHFSKRMTWGNSSFETYLLLSPKVSMQEIESEMNAFVNRNIEESGRWYTLSLQPLSEVHLGSADIASSYTSRIGDPRQLQLLFYLAIIILIIASINYMNLATARSEQRVKEVAISKTIGASRSRIMVRFYLETALMVGIAVFVSMILLIVSLPLYNAVADKSFEVAHLSTPTFLGGLTLISILIIALSGAYPAIYLSGISIHQLFRREKGRTNYSSMIFRKGLVIVQFFASAVLIISTLAFYNQLQFIQNKNLGYNNNQVLAIQMAGAKDRSEINAFVNSLKGLSDVDAVAQAQTFPGSDGSGYTIQKPLDPNQSMMLQTNRVNAHFVDALSINIIAGRNLPAQDRTREDSVVQVLINEKTCSFLGYTPEEAVGKEAPGLFWQKYAEIVGVVEDFHFESLHQPIGLYVMHNNTSEMRNYAIVSLQTNDLRASMEKIEDAFQATIPNSAFDYTFLDDHVDRLYRSEDRTATLFTFFGAISIFIACLGLFGLAAFKAERRKKEIGIRKVLGASISSIVVLLSKEFLILVIISLALALPVAWLLLQRWLENYAYSAGIGSQVFIFASIATIVIAMITTIYQSAKAAVVDPVKSIGAE